MASQALLTQEQAIWSIVDDAYRAIIGDLERRPAPITAETPIYGGASDIDSLSLVLLVSTIEELIMERLGISVLLASERAMSMRHSPYRTVGSLAAFINTELGGA